MENTEIKRERAVLAGLSAASMDESERSTEISMEELAALVDTAGGDTVAIIMQSRPTPDPRSFIGDGKVREMKELIAMNDCDLAVFDNELTPSQMRVLSEELGVKVPAMPELANQGKTPLHFANEKGDYLGTVAAADVLKADSQAAVQAMTKMGLDVVMLTGDNEATAKAIARKAGIAHVISDVLPTDKAGAVGKLQAEGHRVLMVGDGINDAPALVSADVGMAIGAGTDIAIESADVVLMTGSLAAVSGAVELSKTTIRNIRQNLFWAFFYNTLGIPLAAGVLFLPLGLKLSPMFGAAAMSLSSVFVVTNALRLRLFKPKTSPSVVEAPKHEEIKTKEDTIMKTVIKVNGMMCGHCKAHVETACKGVPGVTDAVVDLDAKNVTVTGDADVAALKKAITDAGYEVVE